MINMDIENVRCAADALAWFEEELKGGKCSPDCPQCNSYEFAITALRFNDIWINVDEAIPDDGVRVLSVQEDGIVRLNKADNGVFLPIINRQRQVVKTTHWMFLPEPPTAVIK